MKRRGRSRRTTIGRTALATAIAVGAGARVVAACGGDSFVASAEDASAGADIGVDANAGDGGPSESGADASASYCATLSPAPLFCDDFEGTFGLGWSNRRADQGSVLEPSTDAARGAFAAHLGATDAACAYAWLRKELDAVGSSVRVVFDVNLGAGSPSGVVAVHAAGVDGGAPCGYFVALHPDRNAELFIAPDALSGPTLQRAAFVGAPIGTWSRMSLELVATDAGAGSVTVSVDGQKSASLPVPAGCGLGELRLVDLALYCASGDVDVLVDDVAVYAE